MDLQQFVDEHGQTRAAAILGVTQGAVWQWLNGLQRINADRALLIEEKSGGVITRYELLPDIFGPAPRAPQEAA